MAPHLRSRCRSMIAAALTTALLTPIPAAAADASDQQGATLCTAGRDATFAARVSQDIRAALSSRAGSVSVSVHDTRTGLVCELASHHRYDAASVAKVLMMEAALRRAQEWGRGLTAWEHRRIRPMITRSDNDAAGRLWSNLGRPFLSRFLHRAGTTGTTLGPYGYWGLTRTTAADQQRLLGVLTGAPGVHGVLGPNARAYGLRQMADVRSDQRWGVPAGMPRGVRAHLKNGWLPRATHGWRVHSVGVFTGGGRTYRIVVLSHGNSTMAYGVRTVERVAYAVHRALHKGRAIAQGFTPESEISEVPDGSAPPEDAFATPGEKPGHEFGEKPGQQGQSPAA
ncbi:serine hydrolase [Streptomyces sp. G44]|uniref:serine hydrolase n=1 Tax=Streptomyces sp. G44 TaxID=2807632 RepID=UPI001960A2E3|nr:serine hydrolase [Streptomyces sp. G44]MBM7173637.1 serine hydrolase [Streptomyces sp. G44]